MATIPKIKTQFVAERMRLVLKIRSPQQTLVLQLLYDAFCNNPNILWMTNGCNTKRIQAICKFCLDLSILHRGAYLSPDKKGVLLAFEKNVALKAWQLPRLLLIYCKFIFCGVHFTKVWKLILQQRDLIKMYPKNPYLYCLMLSSKQENKDFQTLVDLKNFLFVKSKRRNLPIYVQTSLRRNKILFEHAGFREFASWKNNEAPYKLTMMCKACRLSD